MPFPIKLAYRKDHIIKFRLDGVEGFPFLQISPPGAQRGCVTIQLPLNAEIVEDNDTLMNVAMYSFNNRIAERFRADTKEHVSALEC